jgi:uncharacterized protein
MLNLSDKELKLVQSILEKYPYQFYAFGSRVKGKQKKYSDLDLCYKDPIPDAVITKIYEDFEMSALSFKVELLNWNRCDSDFQRSIEKDLIRLEEAGLNKP